MFNSPQYVAITVLRTLYVSIVSFKNQNRPEKSSSFECSETQIQPGHLYGHLLSLTFPLLVSKTTNAMQVAWFLTCSNLGIGEVRPAACLGHS